MFDQIVPNIAADVMDKHILIGAAGALVGAYVSVRQEWGVGGILAGVAVGHFTGHYLANHVLSPPE